MSGVIETEIRRKVIQWLNYANQALADRRHFELDDDQWQSFQQALDRPVQTSPRLKRLLTEPGVLDCGGLPEKRPLPSPPPLGAGAILSQRKISANQI